MARLLDLADEDGEPEAEDSGKQAVDEQDDRPNPNLGAFSASLGCYP